MWITCTYKNISFCSAICGLKLGGPQVPTSHVLLRIFRGTFFCPYYLTTCLGFWTTLFFFLKEIKIYFYFNIYNLLLLHFLIKSIISIEKLYLFFFQKHPPFSLGKERTLPTNQGRTIAVNYRRIMLQFTHKTSYKFL